MQKKPHKKNSSTAHLPEQIVSIVKYGGSSIMSRKLVRVDEDGWIYSSNYTRNCVKTFLPSSRKNTHKPYNQELQLKGLHQNIFIH